MVGGIRAVAVPLPIQMRRNGDRKTGVYAPVQAILNTHRFFAL